MSSPVAGNKGNPGDRGEAVLAIFKRGADFMKQLIDENEGLRKQISEVEARQRDAARDPVDWEDLRVDLLGRIRILEDEKDSILEQLRSVESENQQFAERYLDIEEENNNLANLYVASYQLHSTLDPGEVLKVILEIVINSLLSQKDGVAALDHELFTLLAGHAATAIFASPLYAQSERKLNTIRGFIDLLTK